MMKQTLSLLAFTLCASFAMAADGDKPAPYFVQMPSGFSIYKIEAMHQLVTPVTAKEAQAWSRDERVQELIGLAEGVDRLLYDGFRLVRFRGALVTNDAIDAYAIDRAVYYFNVTSSEAKAWLLASRLMQMSKFKDDGAALVAIEQELLNTAGDIYYRLQTYVGQKAALSYMPRMAYGWGFGQVERVAPPPMWTVRFAAK